MYTLYRLPSFLQHIWSLQIQEHLLNMIEDIMRCPDVADGHHKKAGCSRSFVYVEVPHKDGQGLFAVLVVALVDRDGKWTRSTLLDDLVVQHGARAFLMIMVVLVRALSNFCDLTVGDDHLYQLCKVVGK